MIQLFLPGLMLAAAAAARAPAAPPPDQQLLAYLNETIAWVRGQSAQQLASQAADLVYVSEARQLARETLALSFETARAEAALLPAQPAPAAASARPLGAGFTPGMLAKLAADAAQRVQDLQAEVERYQHELQAAAASARRADLERQLAESRSELALAQARQDTVRSFASLVSTGGGTGGGGALLQQIDELERSTPEAHAVDKASAPAAAQAGAALRKPEPTGALGLASDVIALTRELHGLRLTLEATARLRTAADKLREPLLAELQSTLLQGDRVAAEADTSDPATLGARTKAIDELTGHFRKVSAALVPLTRQRLILDTFRTTLGDWISALDAQYDSELRGLLLRAVLLGIAIALILAASEFWRRATFRYVQDVRRRHQLMLVRRIVVALALTLFVLFALVTELGSLATFAGFITAGLAVALQNVILSVAAYFFLIGKYGVRIGDRVQISGVSGDVVDIGLVRLHLLELGAAGLPTGRVVVFSNAVLFQPAANFFKQIPGSSYSWHQVSLTLAPGGDYRAAEQRLLGAVDKVYATVRQDMDAQHQRIAQTLAIRVEAPRPESRLRLTDAGLELVIRFPVPLDRSSTIDDEVTRALLEAIAAEPRLRLAGSQAPQIEVADTPTKV